jgi:hypothetical protein
MEVHEVPAYVFTRLATEPQAAPDVFGEAHIGQYQEEDKPTAWLRLSTTGPVTTLGLYTIKASARHASLEQPALLCVEAGFSDNCIDVPDRNLGSHALRIVSYAAHGVTDGDRAIRMEVGAAILRQTLRAASKIHDIRFVQSHVDSLSARSRNS